jgi:hypothetical protein
MKRHKLAAFPLRFSKKNIMTTTAIPFSIEDYVATVRRKIGFAKGRALRLAEQRAALEAPTRAVRQEIDLDKLREYPARGRAARISRILRASFRPELSAATHRRWTARILAGLPDVNQK